MTPLFFPCRFPMVRATTTMTRWELPFRSWRGPTPRTTFSRFAFAGFFFLEVRVGRFKEGGGDGGMVGWWDGQAFPFWMISFFCRTPAHQSIRGRIPGALPPSPRRYPASDRFVLPSCPCLVAFPPGGLSIPCTFFRFILWFILKM